MKEKQRCAWPSDNQLTINYHDNEWGAPLHNDKKLFEFMVLDAFQAGLNWSIILKKRKNFEKAFSGFDPRKVAKYTKRDFERLMDDAGIIRNKLKISAAINNAQKFLGIQKEFGSFDKYIWRFTNYKTIHHGFKSLKDLPAKTKESDEMSIDLKERGFKFVGSTICYAFMQAAGMVNDHTVGCYRYRELKK
ncbi:MAG: DNA-3-methyladenine glycosylase I [Nanoarchaeota archaeon]